MARRPTANTANAEKPKAKAKSQVEANNEMMKKARVVFKKCLNKAALAKSEDNETSFGAKLHFMLHKH